VAFNRLRGMKEFSLGSVEVSLTPLERFEEFLQSRGKRITQQRKFMVNHVFRRHEHFDADELLDELGRVAEGRRISRPTVYRTLRELVDAGLLRQMVLGGRSVYEHDYGYPQHDHLHCQKCNKLIEFRSDELGQLLDAVARDQNFRITGHRLIVSGICEDCVRSGRRKRPLDLI
jgi:Fur family ferric uptake transcriptional regulator